MDLMTMEWKFVTLRPTVRLALAAAGLAMGLLLQPVAAAANADPAKPPQDQPQTEAVGAAAAGEAQPEADTTAEAAAAAGPVNLAERWGIEVTSLRLTANDHMIDFRYRVLDPVKAEELFVRQNKPALIHQETGKVLVVPNTAKVGPLRNSDTPQAGRIYWMFFGNAGNLVKAGDAVTVVIGEFRAENLVVE
jgi:hypothetical protein